MRPLMTIMPPARILSSTSVHHRHSSKLSLDLLRQHRQANHQTSYQFRYHRLEFIIRTSYHPHHHSDPWSLRSERQHLFWPLHSPPSSASTHQLQNRLTRFEMGIKALILLPYTYRRNRPAKETPPRRKTRRRTPTLRNHLLNRILLSPDSVVRIKTTL